MVVAPTLRTMRLCERWVTGSLPTVRLYSRQLAQAVGNRQPDDEHVHEEAYAQILELVWPRGVKGAQRQNDEIHGQKNRDPEEDSANQEMLLQEL